MDFSIVLNVAFNLILLARVSSAGVLRNELDVEQEPLEQQLHPLEGSEASTSLIQDQDEETWSTETFLQDARTSTDHSTESENHTIFKLNPFAPNGTLLEINTTADMQTPVFLRETDSTSDDNQSTFEVLTLEDLMDDSSTGLEFLADSGITEHLMLTEFLDPEHVLITEADGGEISTAFIHSESWNVNETLPAVDPRNHTSVRLNTTGTTQELDTELDSSKPSQCPWAGVCIFWFLAQDTCETDHHCAESRICCKYGCSKTCVET